MVSVHLLVKMLVTFEPHGIYTQQKKLRKSQKTMQLKNT